MSKKWLENSTVILTGASSGIGRDIAKILIEKHNCRVVGIGRNEQKLIDFSASLKENSKKFSYRLFDVSELENWVQFSNFLIENNINANVLINCAGMLPCFQTFEKTNLTDLEYVMKVNFMSCTYSIKTLLPLLLKENNSAIINIASSAALASLPGTSIYSASKSALKSFTECLTIELKKKCYVGLICPGFVRTDIMRNQHNKNESKLVNFVSMKSYKMAKKIVKGISKKKKRMVFGFDAKAMDRLYRIFPKLSLRFFNLILKFSRISLFEDVYEHKSERYK